MGGRVYTLEIWLNAASVEVELIAELGNRKNDKKKIFFNKLGLS